MAESRIHGYDGKMVTFEYEDKAEKTHKVLTLSGEEFLKRLVRHIHDRHFRQIRYAGIYATRSRQRDGAAARACLKLEQGKRVAPMDWRERRRRENGFDPLICPRCGSELVLVEVAYRSRDGPLKERVLDN